MATMATLAPMKGAATAHVDVSPSEIVAADAVPVTPQQHGSTPLPADGMVLAESTAYRTVNHGLLSHTAGLVVKQAVSIKLVPGGKYQLITGEHESYLMDAADWELRPASIEQIVPTVHTCNMNGDTTKEVVLAGEFEGEDLPLYDFELHYKRGLMNKLLHPNHAGAAHKLQEGQHKLVRLGFETQLEAQEWYALLCIALGTISLDCPSLDGLATALAASKKARSYNATN